MKVQRASLVPEADEQQWRKREEHLPRGNHRGRELLPARFDENVRVGGGGRAQDNHDAAPESHESLKIEQLRANNCDATKREQSAKHAFPLQRFFRQIEMREDE